MKLKNTILTSFLFFLVLASWYVIRGIRNEMAVENYGQDFLLILLSFTALTMLIVNPIYSWIASRKNFKKHRTMYSHPYECCSNRPHPSPYSESPNPQLPSFYQYYFQLLNRVSFFGENLLTLRAW